MANKSHHAKFLSAIRDAVQQSTDEENVSYIVGSLLLFEQNYAHSNKENFRKLLSEALAVYGPGSSFDGDDRVIPLYILLGKYSRSSTHAEIFDRMNETGTYRKSALFYVEWGKVFQQAGHSSRALEVIHEGIKRNAKPESLLQAAIVDMGLETTTVSSTPGRVLGTFSAPRSARKQLFPKAPTPMRKRVEASFVLPVEAVDPSRIAPVSSESVTPLLPLPNLDDSRSEDAENERPVDISQDIFVKRKTLGVLVPATGFVLEDYDLAKVYEEDEKRTEKAENNRMNIENNVMPSPGRRLVNNSPPPTNSRDDDHRSIFQPVNSASEPQTTVPAVRALFQTSAAVVEPVVPTNSELPTSPKERFVSGSEALKFLCPESDEEVEDKRLTGFALLLEKRKSLGKRTSLAPPVAPLLNNRNRAADPLEGLFSKMTVSAPCTSKD